MGIQERRKREKETFRETVLKEAYGMIQQTGIKGFSLRQLAQKLEVSASKLYQFFENKEEIITALSETLTHELHETLKKVPCFRDKEKYLLQLSMAHLEYYQKAPNFHELIQFCSRKAPSFQENSASKGAKQLFESALHSLGLPLFARAEKIKEGVDMLLSLIIGISANHAMGIDKLQVEKMMEESVRTLLLGFKARER